MKTTAKILTLCLLTAALHCNGDDGKPLLSFLTNGRMKIIMKGSYASDRPLEMSEINNNTLFVDPDDTPDLTFVPNYDALPIFIDFGEIRLSSKENFMENIQSDDDAQDFWDVLSPTRQVYCSHPYALDVNNDRCTETGGLINYIEFMNGRGAVYPSNDVGPGVYHHSGIFVRAFATGYAMLNGALKTDEFDNNDIFGQNIISRVHYSPGTDPAEIGLRAPQFFPLHYWASGGAQSSAQTIIDDSYSAMIVDMRFNIKENLMLHTYANSDAQTQTLTTFSDWRSNHTGETDMGGNVLTRTRIYYPDFTTSIRICDGTKSTRHYYAVYLQDKDLKEESLPMAATPARNGADNIIRNLMTGSYTIQCRYDCTYDGYPETVLDEMSFELAVGTGQDVSEACNLNFQCGSNFPDVVNEIQCTAP